MRGTRPAQAIVCDEFFVPSLGVITEKLQVSNAKCVRLNLLECNEPVKKTIGKGVAVK